MEYRKLGTLSVSSIGLGCNNFGSRLDEAASMQLVHSALDEGVNFFDTADMYGETLSEVYLGKALQGRRDKAVVATKFGQPLDSHRLGGARPAYIRRALEDSLRRLQTDYVDLYILHRPDLDTPIADTLITLQELVREGKILQIGCSNFSAEQLAAADACKGQSDGFSSVQNEFSLLHREPEENGVLEECRRLGVAFVPYFPLASGLLTGKYRRGQPAPSGSRIARGGYFSQFLTEARLRMVEDLLEWTQGHDRSLLELAFGWLLSRSEVPSVIAGATSVPQLQQNVRAGSWRLTESEFVEVSQLLTRVGV